MDRIDPSKNIVRGFKALDLLFERHPEHLGKVRLLALLVPSRLGIEEYQQYLDEVIVTAQRLNLKYGDREWQPVDLIVGEDQARAVAAMQLSRRRPPLMDSPSETTRGSAQAAAPRVAPLQFGPVARPGVSLR